MPDRNTIPKLIRGLKLIVVVRPHTEYYYGFVFLSNLIYKSVLDVDTP